MAVKIPLQFGWEAEYSPSECGALLADYSPDPEFIPSDIWETFTEVQKKEWLAQKIEAMGFGNKSAILRKKTGRPGFLPQLAYRDWETKPRKIGRAHV